MYQNTAIDTSQITQVNVSAVSGALPEVTVGGVVVQTPQPEPLTQPASSELLTPQVNQSWPSTQEMFQELQQSGILTQSYQPPVVNQAPEISPPKATEPPAVISLANTTVSFERPNAEYLLNQTESSTHLSISMIVGVVGLLLILGIVGFTYSQLKQSGMDNQDIIQTTLDAVSLSR